MRVDRFFEARFPGLTSPTSSASSAKARCASTASAPSRRTGWRPGRRCAFRRCGSMQPKPRAPEAGRRKDPRLPNRSRSTRTPTCWSSTSRWGWRCRAVPAPRAISTACWRCCATRRASVRASCTGSTRTPPAASGRQDAVCRRRARQDLPLALGAQGLLGPGRGCAEGAQGRISTFLAKDEREDESSCASPATARRAPAMP